MAFDFPPTNVISTATVVAASGIVASKPQMQVGRASALTSMVTASGFDITADMVSFGGIESTFLQSAFEGVGQDGGIIVAKLPGSEDQGVVLTYSNIVQNSSFESGSSWWTLIKDEGTDHGVNIVSEYPRNRGFDNVANDADLAVPNGSKMLHMFKVGETGTVSLYQTIDELSHTSLLGVLQFSVASDSAFTGLGDPAARLGMIALEFINSGVTFYTLAYTFTSNELPKRPPSFPTIDKVILLSQESSDKFETFTRILPDDVDSTFSFTQVKVWIVTDMEDTVFAAEFDTLWDWILVTTGQAQNELFPTQVDQPILQSSITSTTDYRNFLGVLGTRETYERDFDRSPFFFTPTELDPNTERDRTEVEPFYLFSNAFIRTYESLLAIPNDVPLISVKGAEVEDEAFAPTSVVLNGGFEFGDFSSWVVSSGTNTGVVESSNDVPGGYFPSDIFPEEGTHFAFVSAPDTGNTESQWIRQTVMLPQNYSSEVLGTFFWQHMPSFISSNRHFSTNLIFSSDGEDVFHLKYTYNSSSPVDPPEFTDMFPISYNLGGEADVLTSYVRNLISDTNKASFDFNRVDIWHIVASSFIDSVSIIDAFSLTVDIPPDHLLQTTDLAHILNVSPVTSGTPFTVSGTDQINQIDQTPPFFDETFPASGTTFNPTEGILSFHIKDAHSNLDTTNLDVWVDGVRIVNASTVETGATWPSGVKTVLSNRDIQYDFTRVTDYPQQSTVTVSGEITDLADPVSNQDITEYQFSVLGSGTLDATISGSSDGDPPVLSLGFPQDLDTQVSPNTELSWVLIDDSSGVDPSSVRFLINGSVKIEDDLATAGSFSRPANSERGFNYTYIPAGPFTFGETVTGTIDYSDFVGNSSSTEYEFTITPAETLTITNFFMDQGSSILVSSGTEFSVCVEDSVYGVSVGGSSFKINGVVPSGLVVTTSGPGPDKVTYSIPVAGLIDNRSDISIFVHAENNFPGPFPVIEEQTFLLHPGYDVNWANRSTGIAAGTESVFPFLTKVQVLSDVKNFGKNFNEASLFYDFLTENEHKQDLGAVIISNIKTADLPASLNPTSTIFEYGKIITIEVEVEDNEGNKLSFTHIFTIEDK